VSPRIRWGSFGQFDVVVDGQVVFSKKAAGRMPNPGEVRALMNARRA
jgi:predicted Rdx family selenoprotein